MSGGVARASVRDGAIAGARASEQAAATGPCGGPAPASSRLYTFNSSTLTRCQEPLDKNKTLEMQHLQRSDSDRLNGGCAQ